MHMREGFAVIPEGGTICAPAECVGTRFYEASQADCLLPAAPPHLERSFSGMLKDGGEE